MAASPRAVLAGTLRRLGIERAGHARSLREALTQSEQRIVELKKLLEQSRQETASWKARFREGETDGAERRRAEQEQHKTRMARLEERSRQQAQKLEIRDAARQEKVHELRQKIIAAERSVRVGREHQMAIEVKLDLIEGAINVLDRRLRAVATPLPEGAKRGL